ncbi:MAG: signal peptidase II [Candidatus Dormibacteraeota bacterium]|uniref:Lipoprotein signal peptidase n=1 Tax=Candidatus Aeolococcus gillhamiae TaxID=3127015 RepID=A0A2W6AL82_9BACT|nr:signal peptidase II [Candidatus Dormibacteraeota bacterium]PZR78501.1 MAG: signal peptidase II [Candidatus Dormibacter sp. RRmetagenome_bin12]
MIDDAAPAAHHSAVVAEVRPPGRRRQLTVLLGTAVVVFLVDHVTKWLVTQNIALGDQVPGSGPITIHHIENRGAAFGLFPQMQFIFLAVAVAVAAYILVAGRRFGPGVFPQVLLGMVLGGALANAVDRVVQGYVVDFIDLQRWPVFNVADMAIVLGILVGVLTLRMVPVPAVRGDSDPST